MCNVLVKPMDFRRVYRPQQNIFDIDTENNPPDSSQLSNHSDCLLAVLTDDKLLSYEVQPEFGRKFNKNDYFTYKTQTIDPENLGFSFDFYLDTSVAGSAEKKYKRFGLCYVHPPANETFGRRSITILSLNSRLIGQMNLDFAIIHPLPIEVIPKDMSQSFVRHWKKRKSLDVGHRGMGTSNPRIPPEAVKKSSMVKENTINSLNSAAKYGADYVEFDVQLSKDAVPILFHDFRICLAVQKLVKRDDYFLHEVSVNRLTLNDMHRLRLFHENDTANDNAETLNDAKDEKQKPFPTFDEIFAAIDSSVGFNVEIKYPMITQEGFCEADNALERNKYVDKILTVVLRHSCEQRRIIFSSFDPLICIILKLKQNRYPVMFLNQGDTERYPTYSDPLTQTLTMAVAFAVSNQLLGISIHSEPLLKNAEPFHKAIKNNLICFVWGEDLESEKNLEYFKTLGFHGLIYDRINDHVPGKRNVFLMEKESSERSK